jgi:hypothetical protein
MSEETMYIDEVMPLLEDIFLRYQYKEHEEDELGVKKQYDPYGGYGKGIYGLKPDIAVGPFSATGLPCFKQYDDMINNTDKLIKSWIDAFQRHWSSHIVPSESVINEISPRQPSDFHTSYFARNEKCFIAIEVDDSKKKNTKRLLGSLINAGVLGRIGILAAQNDIALYNAIRFREYLEYFYRERHIPINMGNVIVMMAEELKDSLEKYSQKI